MGDRSFATKKSFQTGMGQRAAGTIDDAGPAWERFLNHGSVLGHPSGPHFHAEPNRSLPTGTRPGSQAIQQLKVELGCC